ncbi:hypothetical protein CEXT_757781 [Caerostris extrusa]|uniref:Secreted protein n=1 Tax=Caerostris extrusa TaxID=172846 RepID=A0AAV4P3V5_CAEEX|nr:hypothetical protein CEXT_757781 [Caerostris extrusa]
MRLDTCLGELLLPLGHALLRTLRHRCTYLIYCRCLKVNLGICHHYCFVILVAEERERVLVAVAASWGCRCDSMHFLIVGCRWSPEREGDSVSAGMDDR